MYSDKGSCRRTACLYLAVRLSMTHQETWLAPKTGKRVGSLGVARVKDLQGCWTGRGKADLDRHETYILFSFST